MNKARYTNSVRYKCLEHLQKQSLDLYLCYCGKEICDPGHTYGPMERTEYLIHYILDGKGTYTVGDKTYHLEKNQAFLICPGVTTVYRADEQEPWTYIWIAFNGVKAQTCLEYAGLSQKAPVVHIPAAHVLEECVDAMLAASHLTYANELKRTGYLNLFLSYFVEVNGRSSKDNTKDYPAEIYVEHVLDYIDHNYQHNIKIGEVAKRIGIDRSYLTNSFKKRMHMSPQQYLLRYRMDKAAVLIKTTTHSIHDISVMVGYPDPLAFSKVFKAYSGLSPKAYREASEEPIKAYKKGE